RALGYLQFRGEITGFLRDFVTTGTLRTGLGQLTADLSMKLPVGRQPVYSGHIKTDRFQLGRLLHDQELGDAGFALSVRGSGFRPADRSVTLQGQVNYLDYRTDRFDRITVDGRLEKRRFEGVATLQDALARFTLNGTIDLNGPLPRFNLLADIAHADLRGLHLVRDSVTFSGKANVDFIGSDLDDFMGTARITEARLTRNEEVLPFDSLVLATTRVDGLRSFEARSNEFRAELTGDYHLDEVPATARVLLHRYYPSVVKMPASMPRPQAFRFDIESYYIDPFLQLIDPTLTGFNNTHLKGRIDLPQHLFVLDADIPQFRFRGTNFESIRLVAEGNADRLVLNGQVRNVNINDSLSIPQAYFRISARNDSSRVSVQTGASQAVEKADLNALVLTYDDGLKVEFEPSTFTVNGKAWTIGENGEVVLRSSTPASGQLLLTEGDERILLRTRPSDAGKWNDIDVELTNVNLGDFAPFFLPHNRLEGLLSGRIRVENPTGDLRVVSDDLSTRFLRLDNDSLGGVRASVDYDGRTRELKLRGATENQENYLGFEGSLYLNDPASALSNRILLRARQFEISVLERFLGNLFSDMQGYLTGDIQLSGPFGGLTVTGKGRLKDAGLKVKFTQCFYRIEDTDVELTPSEIRLDGLVLRDPVTGNPIFITGGIEHRSFRDMFYDLTISTRKPQTVGLPFNRPVQLLQTTYRDNKQFYGNARGTGSLSLIGPQENLYMKIDVVASETDSSSITLPPSSSRESGVADFMVERRYGREMTDAELRAGSTNIIYDVDITVNKTPIPRVAVKIMLDELTGDEIKGKGSGSINIRSGTSEPLRLRGRFDIEEGSYLFTFQSFFKKPFELRKGGDNYIEWNGDPYDANIRFQAMYRAERVSFAPLAELLRFSSNASNARGDVYVVATLTEKLFKPVIQFALDFPSGSIAVTDPELALVVQQMQKNINEINRQVTYLIVFNSFAPSELTAGAGSFNVAGTISGIFLNVISDQINKILGNLLKSDKYTISLNTSIYNRNIINTSNATSLQLGSNINFSIGRSFFNNRFIVSTGLGFDAPLQAASANTQVFSQQLLPDVTLEWLINNSGSLRASFFYRENTDFLSTGTGGGPGRARRIGASLSYRRDFDRLQDLLRRKLATQPPVTEPPPRQP
ncbi:MAG: hypothetical protein RJA57_1045, partial [Bacteroidota bacterium]